MAVSISLLFKINEVLEKISSIESKISHAKLEIESIQLKNSKNQEAFKQNQIELQIQNKILEGFANNQKKLSIDEIQVRRQMGKKIDSIIDEYLNKENLLKLIENIKSSNSEVDFELQAGNDVARNIGLSEYTPIEDNQLRVIVGVKIYNLDLEVLKQDIQNQILILVMNS